MFKYEIIRFIKSKGIYYFLILLFIILMTNELFMIVFDEGKEMYEADLFLSIIQFSFFTIPALIIGNVQDDFNNGIHIFYRQNRYKETNFILSKILVYNFIPIVYTFTFMVLTFSKFNMICIMLLFIALEMEVLICIFLAVVFTQKWVSFLIVYVMIIVGNIFNLIDSIIFLPEAHSVMFSIVEKQYGLPITNLTGRIEYSIEFVVILALIEICILLVLIVFFNKKRNERVI